ALWKVAEHLFPPCSPSSSLESALIERSDPGPDLQLRSTHFTRSQRRSPASGTGLASARGRDRRSHILDLRLRPTTTYGLCEPRSGRRGEREPATSSRAAARNLRHRKGLRQRGRTATAAAGSTPWRVVRQLFVNFPARVA